MDSKSFSELKNSLNKINKLPVPQNTGSKNVNSTKKNNSKNTTKNKYSKENSNDSIKRKYFNRSTFDKNNTNDRNERSVKIDKPYKEKINTKQGVKIIPLGGVGEVGKNMTLYEYENDIFVVDCGLIFPDVEMYGVDLVIPNYTYLVENKHKIKAFVITHGHEDHIGALPYILKDVNVPVYATKFTLGLIESKLKEHNLLKSVEMHVIKPGDVTKLGVFSIEYIRVNHSIPDSVSLAIKTPVGTIIQTGDFKVDFTPINEDIIDLIEFGKRGANGVVLLLSDSTNSEKPGLCVSEKVVGKTFDSLFAKAIGKRVVIASFASNVHRVQQIVDMAIKYNRKITVSGRSMENVTEIARTLGYLKVPSGLFVDINEMDKLNPEQVIIITTGSQGEPMAALSRMASYNHKHIQLTNNDFVIISAKPVPGNEKAVTRVINDLLKTGCEVVYESTYDIHVSGHAYQEELKMMLHLTKPKFFMPVHGEFKQLKKHAELGKIMGVKEDNIIIPSLGKVYELTRNSFKQVGEVTSGKILVDGLGVGDVGSVVLRDRKHLSEDGLIVVVISFDSQTATMSKSVDIVSRGFVYVKESESLMYDIKQTISDVIQKCEDDRIKEWGAIKIRVREKLSEVIYQKTKRNPMILPIITEF